MCLFMYKVCMCLKRTRQFGRREGVSRSLRSWNWIHKVLELDPKGFGVNMIIQDILL